MSTQDFWKLLRRKFYSLLMILIPTGIIFLILALILRLLPYFLPAEMLASWKETLKFYATNPAELKALLLAKGADAEWIFILIQVLQVVFAPIPGQAAALAGGFIFGFWKGDAGTCDREFYCDGWCENFGLQACAKDRAGFDYQAI